jgi:hypothetical protein
MRTAILVTAMHTLVSALIPAGSDPTNELRLGTPLALERDYENEHGTIPAGTRGCVVSHDRALGCYWCKMEGCAPALVRWDNLIVLWAFESVELLDAVVTLKERPVFTDQKASQLAAS